LFGVEKMSENVNVRSIGHRGFRIGVDENTFMAFDQAVALGLDYIEFDVQMTADGVPVVLYDASLERMTGKKENVQNKTLKELKTLKTINHKQEIPTLEQVYERYGNNIGFMIDIKDIKAADSVIQLIQSGSNKKGICISGRDIDTLNYMIDKLLYTEVCFNMTNNEQFTLQQLYDAKEKSDIPVNATMISLSSKFMTQEFIDKCKSLDIKPGIVSLGPEKEGEKKLREWIANGIEFVLFDDPEHYKLYMNELNAENEMVYT